VDQYWKVAVNTPLNVLFTYRSTDGQPIPTGTSVYIPFGKSNRKVSGLILGQEDSAPEGFKSKDITECRDDRPTLSESYLKWLTWLSTYYNYPLGKIQESVFAPLKKKEGPSTTRKPNPVPELPLGEAPSLTETQEKAITEFVWDGFQPHLLFGVTGSGKTEVYIQLAQKTLQENKAALVLVPEIALTPQLLHRFSERFPGQVAVIHSQLTPREKTNQWWSVVEGKKKILLGARSALFCPIPNLGLIIVDEEHESSFKQEEKLRYQARDSAVTRAKFENIPIVLGSATPSIETWNNVLSKRYHLLEMPERVSKRELPSVEIIDMKKKTVDLKAPELPFWLSSELYWALENNWKNKNQSALFLNRRGMAQTTQCYDCGFIYVCPNCDISLTLHGTANLVCHYCEYYQKLDTHCPDCKEGEPKPYGLGTEMIEVELGRLFPGSRILRADRDEVTSRADIERLIADMEANAIDFLVGTQMIAKGLDFKNLTLVGIVHADIALNQPDFRASERCFQLCTQVSGRAGRHQKKGSVYIQTFVPDHPSLLFSKDHDYRSFVAEELPLREAFDYPPFGRLALIRFSGTRKTEVEQLARQSKDFLNGLIETYPQLADILLLGPGPAPIARLKNRFRFQLLIKSKNNKVLEIIKQRLQTFLESKKPKSKVQIDTDPCSFY